MKIFATVVENLQILRNKKKLMKKKLCIDVIYENYSRDQ